MKESKKKYKCLLCAIVCLGVMPTAKGDFLREGREAFMNYDFDLALENYEKYAKSLKKTPNAQGEELLEKYMRQLEVAENSLENVQKIEIIDRIDVPAEAYFKQIKLPATGGKLVNPDASVLSKRHNQSDYAYASESGDLMMWSEIDESQQETLMQSERLMNGSWERPVKVGEILNDGGNARNPFLLPDGLTLYYSSDGDGSMGGYDLFVATRDAVTGEFRQPIPLGYPFNSPYNEFMMAIDEENGIGWWVTDRNKLDGQVSVYVFKTNDVRKNYSMDDEEDIISLARLDDIKQTQNQETDYNSILKDIDTRFRQSKPAPSTDFIFPLSGGKVAKRLSDFSTNAAKQEMEQYLRAVKEYELLEEKLNGLRIRYNKTDRKSGGSTALKNQILELESKRELQNDRLKKMRNSIISAETKK